MIAWMKKRFKINWYWSQARHVLTRFGTSEVTRVHDGKVDRGMGFWWNPSTVTHEITSPFYLFVPTTRVNWCSWACVVIYRTVRRSVRKSSVLYRFQSPVSCAVHTRRSNTTIPQEDPIEREKRENGGGQGKKE